MQEVTYSQDEVDELKRQWELQAFEVKTKEVLAQINRRLDESNNYKSTIGKDVREIKTRIEQIEAARQGEIDHRKETQSWHQSWWVRIGILSAIIFQLLNFLINSGAIH